MEDNRQNTGFYDIVRKCKGGIVLDMPSFDSTSINRRIEIAHNAEKVRVPRVYALGIFVSPVLERMYKEGYFTVEPNAEFERDVESIFYPVVEKKETQDDATILQALKDGNRVAIKEYIDYSDTNKDKVLFLTRENIDILSSSMIKDIEKIFGVELVVEGQE